jgi:putative RecB family exonuclease
MNDELNAKHPSAFSPTAIGMWERCPRSYAHAYLLKTEADEAPSPHLVFGNALHEALAFLFRLPIDDRDTAAAHRALRHFWMRQRGRKEAFLTVDEETSWGLAALAALELFCTRRREELQIKPIAVEEWVRATVDGGHAVAGKVDRVERIEVRSAAEEEPLRGLRVTDYKSGKAKITESDDLAQDRAAQIYAVAASQTFREPVLEMRLLYLRENVAVTWALERDDLPALESELGSVSDRLLADQEFETRPSFLCRWCKFRAHCPEGSGQVDLDQLEPEPSTSF